MSAYLVTRPSRAVHVSGWPLRPVCGQVYDTRRWWPALADEIATRRMCSRCVAVVKQMTTLIEQATT